MTARSGEEGSQPDRGLDRYSRQMLCAQIGEAGQRSLRRASVTLLGCGALGGVLANTLVRAGVGALRIIDRDFIELNNLQRQTLFDEQDIAANLPKAEAAARKLRRVNSAVETDGIVADVQPGNVEELCGESDLILDGTDNLETRYLINDVAVKHGLPWVYAACIATEGLVLAIVPQRTPCLRCVWDVPPAPGALATCDTAGVLAAAANVVASLAATEAMKILIGRPEELAGLLTVDVWTGRVQRVNVQAARAGGECPCCQRGQYEFLGGDRASSACVLCGRDAVQVSPAAVTQVSFRSIVGRLPSAAKPSYSEYMLRFRANELVVTLFPDGRAIVQGTTDPAVARGVIAKYVGT